MDSIVATTISNSFSGLGMTQINNFESDQMSTPAVSRIMNFGVSKKHAASPLRSSGNSFEDLTKEADNIHASVASLECSGCAVPRIFIDLYIQFPATVSNGGRL